MQIKAVAATPTPVAAPPLSPKVAMAVDAAKAVAERRVPAVTEAALNQILKNAPQDAPQPAVDAKLSLDIDEASGRIVGRVVDRSTGETIRQIPSDEMLRLIAATKEFLGSFVDQTA